MFRVKHTLNRLWLSVMSDGPEDVSSMVTDRRAGFVVCSTGSLRTRARLSLFDDIVQRPT